MLRRIIAITLMMMMICMPVMVGATEEGIASEIEEERQDESAFLSIDVSISRIKADGTPIATWKTDGAEIVYSDMRYQITATDTNFGLARLRISTAGGEIIYEVKGVKETVLTIGYKDIAALPVGKYLIEARGGSGTTFLGFEVREAEVTVFYDFSDVHWAYSSGVFLMRKGAIVGYPNGSFLPDGNITRAEFAKIFALAFDLSTADGTGKYIDADFADVMNNAWYKDYVNAVSPMYMKSYMSPEDYLGTPITTGRVPVFKPDEYATREDVVYALMKRLNLPKVNEGGVDRFSDAANCSLECRQAIADAVHYGLIEGYPDGAFMPQGQITRAEAVMMLTRALDL